jgi:hypothetical protein
VFVNEMDVSDGGLKLVVVESGEPVKLRLPVETVVPVAAEILKRCPIEAICPRGTGNFVDPARAPQAVAKVIDGGLREGQGIRLNHWRSVSPARLGPFPFG